MTATTGPHSSDVAAEIRSQPEAWSRALALLPELTEVLPRRGERVAIIGCGTSWFMANAFAARREQLGHGETDCFAASQFPAARRYDRVIALSRSGTTTEVARAMRTTASPVVAITALAASPVADAARDTVLLDFADERSVVQTVFATTALMLLRGALGEPLEPVVEQARAVLAADGPMPSAVERAEQFTFLGQDWAYGVALEAALKMREAAQLWTEAYPQMEYRHGPIAIAQPGRAVWIFGRPVPGLVDDVGATGAALVDDELDPVADLVRAQLLAVRRAEAQQLDADHPRNLTRSVVLAEGASES